MKRALEWAGYVGLAVLAAAALLPFVGRPEWIGVRWWLVIAGVLLVLASLMTHGDEVRRFFGHRTARYGVNTGIMVILLIGVIGLVEAVSYRHNSRLDLTENKRHSLAPQTIQLLGALKTDVNAVAFFRSDQPGKRVAEDLFKQFGRYSQGKFTWRVVDPDREPGLARRYGIENYGTIVLETKQKSEKVTDAEEEKLTNGLVKVTREGKRVVYVVQGHGEAEITATTPSGFAEAKTAMERANYEVKPLALAREGKVPADAAVVIVPGPRTDFFPPELDALDGFMGKGGKVFVMVNPFQGEGMKKYLGKWGVDLGGVSTLFPLTRTVSPAKTPPGGVTVQPLAKTSAQSWGETNRDALQRGTANPDPQDPKGPLPVAVVATKDKSRLVVYGTSNLAANQFLNLQGNKDFFLNTVSWLAEEEDQISIRPKDTKQTPVFLTTRQAQAAFLLPVVVLPGLVILGGIVAVVRRRAQK